MDGLRPHLVHKDLFALTLGGGMMTNPGRYLTLLPPINGADAFTGTPYFTELPGDQAHQWDATVNFQYMPKEFITFWGRSGIATPTCRISRAMAASRLRAATTALRRPTSAALAPAPGLSDLTAAQAACGGGASSVWFPDLRKTQTAFSMGIMVKF